MATYITNVTELQAMKDAVSGDYVLASNIDASATSSWNDGAGFEPIGTLGSPFLGSFDGNGHIITDLYINRPATDYVGLFGTVNEDLYSAIKNVGLTNVNITGYDRVGGLVGYYMPSIYAPASKLFVTGSVTGHDCVGGLAGLFAASETPSIDNFYSKATVTGNDYVGGAIGAISPSGDIDKCYSTGAVSGNTEVGGLIGYIQFEGTVTNSFWDTETSGQAASAGGTGKTTAQMKTETTFTDAGWDFSTIWAISTGINNGYPYLGETPPTRCFVIPDLFDRKGRVPKGATVKAYRDDTHKEITGVRTTIDTNGTATICELPPDVDVSFHVTWGGSSTSDTERWFYSKIGQVGDGGTGASNPIAARVNLGLGSSNTPQFAGIELGHASDTTLARASAGDVNIEGNIVYRAGGTDVPVTDGGTGASDAPEAASNLGLGTEDSPQFTGIELGHATDTTISRAGAGRVNIENIAIVRAATFVIAPSDAYIQTQADFVCDGDDD